MEFTLENVIVKFTSAEEIVNYVDNLKYFDENCNIIKEKVDKSITLESPMEEILRFQQEMYVVNRLSTIHKFKNVFADLISRNWLKRKITDPSPNYESEITETLGILPHGFGAHMEPDEFEMYVEAFDELYDLEVIDEKNTTTAQ